MGNLERFFSVLIEHYAGAFPVWLSPKQVALIPIADRHIDYVKAVAGQLRKAGLRVMVDDRSERMNAKIRDSQNQEIPYMLVIGDKEIENDQITLRLRSGKYPGPIPVSAFIDRTKDDISRKI